MRFGLEREHRGGAVPPNFLVVLGGRANRHARVRQIRERHEERRTLRLDLADLDLELADALRARLVRPEDRRGVEPFALRTRNLLGRRVLLPFETLDLRQQRAAPRLERRELRQLGLDLQPAVLQARTNEVDVIAHQSGVEHA